MPTSLISLTEKRKSPVEPPFRMKFSPDFGIFSNLPGKDVADQINWGYDQGFRAWECTFLKNRPVEEQERISKILQQEGNLIPTLDYAWDEIAYMQIGDTPGRKEPTTGEINFVNVLRYVYDKGYRGFMGMEHGIKQPGKDGELAALKAYRSIDPK